MTPEHKPGWIARWTAPPEHIPVAQRRIYVSALLGYPQALLWHASFILIFAVVGAPLLAWVNVGSVAIWCLVILLHRAGRLSFAAYLAALEILAHAAICVLFIGWQTGFQFYIIALAAVSFFAPLGRLAEKISVTVFVALVFAGLHLLFADAVPRIALAPWVVDLMYYGNALSLFSIIAVIAGTYDVTTLRAEAALTAQKARSDEMAALLKRMFGRYLSPEVMNSMLEDPSGLELGGERRAVTIMMTDLRGFTALSERLSPEQVVRMLNAYFEVMVDIILRHQGTVNEFIGDALLVVFGAPQAMPDRAARAVACAIEMQNAMREVNANSRALGLPELQMGIGLNDTEVVVGNIGSTKRSKYAVVGSGVNMASRIESYTVGGQVLVSQSVRDAIGDALRIDAQRDVLPKGSESPLRIFSVGGIGGDYQLALEGRSSAPAALVQPVPVRYRTLEGKDVGNGARDARIVALSRDGVLIEGVGGLAPLQNLKLNLVDADESIGARDFYAKVIEPPHGDAARCALRFTAVPPEIDAYLQALRRYGTGSPPLPVR